MEETKYISSVKLNDSVYKIKDLEARQQVQDLLNLLFNEEIIIDCGHAPINDAE